MSPSRAGKAEAQSKTFELFTINTSVEIVGRGTVDFLFFFLALSEFRSGDSEVFCLQRASMFRGSRS